jgi:hypothetical protein
MNNAINYGLNAVAGVVRGRPSTSMSATKCWHRRCTYRLVFMFAILAAALLGGGSGVWLVDRDPPTIIYSAEAQPPVVAAGGELRIDYVVRRLRVCAASVDRFIIDKFKTRYELEDLNVNAGLCRWAKIGSCSR